MSQKIIWYLFLTFTNNIDNDQHKQFIKYEIVLCDELY